MNAGAIFDSTASYRYLLWREWDPQAAKIGFVMLNPSRADAQVNDPTIRRCIGFAQSWNYGALEVVNLFAYCTTDPARLRHVPDPIGAENDRYLNTLGQRVQTIILAWGNGGRLFDRNQSVRSLWVRSAIYCLGRTKTGQPRHPLYTRANTLLLPYSF